jgi:hypothetical protein
VRGIPNQEPNHAHQHPASSDERQWLIKRAKATCKSLSTPFAWRFSNLTRAGRSGEAPDRPCLSRLAGSSSSNSVGAVAEHRSEESSNSLAHLGSSPPQTVARTLRPFGNIAFDYASTHSPALTYFFPFPSPSPTDLLLSTVPDSALRELPPATQRPRKGFVRRPRVLIVEET